ncbi:hypothetical protein EDB89DRAFT_1902130 [Lactarius sanguifluus]|nr:hypothetical protein EDB89DRAFT_1902130 [Lactarius sanguifluus]
MYSKGIAHCSTAAPTVVQSLFRHWLRWRNVCCCRRHHLAIIVIIGSTRAGAALVEFRSHHPPACIGTHPRRCYIVRGTHSSHCPNGSGGSGSMMSSSSFAEVPGMGRGDEAGDNTGSKVQKGNRAYKGVGKVTSHAQWKCNRCLLSPTVATTTTVVTVAVIVEHIHPDNDDDCSSGDPPTQMQPQFACTADHDGVMMWAQGRYARGNSNGQWWQRQCCRKKNGDNTLQWAISMR